MLRRNLDHSYDQRRKTGCELLQQSHRGEPVFSPKTSVLVAQNCHPYIENINSRNAWGQRKRDSTLGTCFGSSGDPVLQAESQTASYDRGLIFAKAEGLLNTALVQPLQ